MPFFRSYLGHRGISDAVFIILYWVTTSYVLKGVLVGTLVGYELYDSIAPRINVFGYLFIDVFDAGLYVIQGVGFALIFRARPIKLVFWMWGIESVYWTILTRFPLDMTRSELFSWPILVNHVIDYILLPGVIVLGAYATHWVRSRLHDRSD